MAHARRGVELLLLSLYNGNIATFDLDTKTLCSSLDLKFHYSHKLDADRSTLLEQISTDPASKAYPPVYVS